jgi:TorA maturation chaperone TorD
LYKLKKEVEMNTNSKRLKTAKDLRDIFLSNNSKELFEAFSSLLEDTNISEIGLEICFNYYFVGPDAPIAPPYASIYLDEEDALMTKTTMQIRDLYEVMGFKNSLKNKVPEDFLGLELDAYYQLLFIEIEKDIPYLKDMRIYFLCEHINAWIFKFIKRVYAHKHEDSNTVNLLIENWRVFLKMNLKLKERYHELFKRKS